MSIKRTVKPKDEKGKSKGLSDKELAEKYETGEVIDFDKRLKMFCNRPSAFAVIKFQKRTDQYSHR